MARTEKQIRRCADDAVDPGSHQRRYQEYDVRGGASLHPRGPTGRLYPAFAASAATAAKSGRPRRMKERR